MYLNPMPEKEELNKFYSKVYYSRQSKIEKTYASLLRDRRVCMLMKIKKRGRILDVGCGDGSFLLCFKKRGWEVYGLDTSETAYKLAKEKLTDNIVNNELENCHFPNRYFDVVTLNHVIEHILNPIKTLEEINRILKDNGILFISTPNIGSLQFKVSREKWFGLDVPRHVNFYTPKTITALLRKNGFNIVRIQYPLLDFPLDLFYSLKVKQLNNLPVLLSSILYLPLLIGSILIKLFPAWRGTLEVIAQEV